MRSMDHANRPSRSRSWSLAVALVGLSALACGRTDPLWWVDLYASDTGTSDVIGDGDGDTNPYPDSITDTDPWATSDSTDADTSWGDTDTDTDTGPTDTSSSDTDTSTGDTDTSTGDTDTSCDDVSVELSAVPTTIVFLLDQGSHMTLNYAGQTRWEAIGEALFGLQQGVVWSWEDQRALGLVSFTSFNGNQGGVCPVLAIVDPQISNGAAMQFEFAGQNPQDDNPVADAITATVALFATNPGHLLLLTGRNPDTCATENSQQAAAAAVTAAQDAFAAGVQTHVIEVGNINANYAQPLANAGVGLDPQGQVSAPYSEPVNTAALTQTLDTLLASLDTCEFTIEPSLLPGGEQLCTVELDGVPLALDDPDGWSLSAPDRITLAGSACESLSQAATPTMLCSCDAF